MASAQIVLNIDDANMTVEVWQAFLQLHPFPDPENLPDVSTKALKLVYAGEALSRDLNKRLSDRVKTNVARAARTAQPNIDLNAGG